MVHALVLCIDFATLLLLVLILIVVIALFALTQLFGRVLPGASVVLAILILFLADSRRFVVAIDLGDVDGYR